MSYCTCGSNWTDDFCERHGRKAGLCRDCDAFKAELARIQKGKASNDADYLKQGAELSRLREAMKMAQDSLKFYANLDWKVNAEAWQLPAKDALSRISAILREEKK